MSLKEALDAAHGHEHAEDGSELTTKNTAAEMSGAAGNGGSGLVWMIVSGVLFLALIVVLAKKTGGRRAE